MSRYILIKEDYSIFNLTITDKITGDTCGIFETIEDIIRRRYLYPDMRSFLSNYGKSKPGDFGVNGVFIAEFDDVIDIIKDNPELLI